jgi:hypothetical protein
MATIPICQAESNRLNALEEMLEELNQEPNTPETMNERKVLLRQLGSARARLQRCETRADLIPVQILAFPAGPQINSPVFDILVEVGNRGGKPVSGSFNIEVTACSPDIIDDCKDANPLISNVPSSVIIPSGSKKTFYCGRFTSRLSEQFPELTYDLSATLDVLKQVNESSESNNTLFSSQVLRIPIIVFQS